MEYIFFKLPVFDVKTTEWGQETIDVNGSYTITVGVPYAPDLKRIRKGDL